IILEPIDVVRDGDVSASDPNGLPRESEATFDDLLDAIEWVESKGDPVAVGKNGEAGAYQITERYIDDVNRILGKNKYTYEDKWNSDKSRQMVQIYLIRHMSYVYFLLFNRFSCFFHIFNVEHLSFVDVILNRNLLSAFTFIFLESF
ncbi:hypothetical protein LCGC14_2007340, partial [marine sediment metagenome]